MGLKNYLLDSNVIIDHFGNKLPKNFFESLATNIPSTISRGVWLGVDLKSTII